MTRRVDVLQRAGLFRRLTAVWIDAFIVYAAASFLISATAVVGVRISLEPLFTLLAAAYGTALLAWKGQTVGKVLIGISVIGKDEQTPGVSRALLREAGGKWGIAVVLPIIVGRLLVGRGWIPTVFDTLVLVPALLLLLIHYLIVRRPWYDVMAGTAAVRVSARTPLAKPALLVLMGAAVLCIGTKATEMTVGEWVPCRLSIYRSMRSPAPYRAFLEKGHPSPVEYVIHLFDKHDVVVLGERAHPEFTQWDFIYDVVRDPRFIERVGRVFTEYGQTGMQGRIDSLMATDGLSADEVHDGVLAVIRNPAVWPIWTNTNWYTYLNRLYDLNQTLPAAKRVRHYLTDVPVDWGTLDREGYRAYRSGPVRKRDELMARSILQELKRLTVTGQRAKALVVMNYRHAFDLTGGDPDEKRWNVYEFLKDAYEDRAANVLLNQLLLLTVPLVGGLWDAAFDELGGEPMGFDFAGSPFGVDAFDFYPLPGPKGRLRYQDVYTGFVYTHPLKDQYLAEGVPGYYEGFQEEALRRAGLLGDQFLAAVAVELEYASQGREITYTPLRTNPAAMIGNLFGRRTKDIHILGVIEPILELLLFGIHGIGLLIGVGVGARSIWC